MTELKIGDVVQLKSGGPLMTIEEIGSFPLHPMGAKCVWFERSEPKSKVFALTSLELYREINNDQDVISLNY